jgi:hypothetical protein
MAMASQLATRPGLAAEGARVGAEFRLGACKEAWTGRRYSPRIAAGVALLIMLASGGFLAPLGLTGLGRAASGGIDAFVFTFGFLLIVLPPRSWTDRLFLCQAGIVLLDARSPEPLVLRWAHLDTMRITIASGYDNDYVSACELRDQAGNAVTVSRRLGGAIKEVAAAAERVLAPRLVPGLIARFNAGEPITVGPVTADWQGLSSAGDSRRTWQVPWREARLIEFELQGQRATVKTGKHVRGERSLSVEGEPNSFVIGYLIAHAAAVARVPVTGHTLGWDGQSGWDPEATITTSTLPAPGTAPYPGPYAGPPAGPGPEQPRHKRHPARTAFVAALVIGILAALALTGAHGGTILTPGNSPGDHIASLGHIS